MSWLLDPYTEPRTYATVAYLLLGLPFGIVGFTIVVVGLTLGLGSIITLIGIPILVATLLFVRAFAAVERRLAWSLLEAPMPHRTPHRDDAPGFFWQRLRRLAAVRRTWSELAFIVIRLPAGIVDFSVAVLVVALMVEGLLQPILVAVGLEMQLGSWTIDTIGESLVAVPVSILFILVGPRILLGWASISSQLATTLLGRVETSELKAAVLDVLGRVGEADAFAVFDELELRIGRGPFLTPVRLAATLLALEGSGRILGRVEGTRTIYAAA